jgi:hypothetical protein
VFSSEAIRSEMRIKKIAEESQQQRRRVTVRSLISSGAVAIIAGRGEALSLKSE